MFLDRETKHDYRILRGRCVPTTVDIEMCARILQWEYIATARCMFNAHKIFNCRLGFRNFDIFYSRLIRLREFRYVLPESGRHLSLRCYYNLSHFQRVLACSNCAIRQKGFVNFVDITLMASIGWRMLQVSKTAEKFIIVFLQLRPLRLHNYGMYGANCKPGATV